VVVYYNGSTTPPTAAGTYNVSAELVNPDYRATQLYTRMTIVASASARVRNEARAQSAEAPVSFGLKAYPNPFTDRFTLSIGGDVAGEVAVTVVDGRGRSVSRQVVQAATAGEERKAEIDLTAETPGMYLLQVQSGAKREIIKVVKMNR
jgi:hypothetical protein